MKLAIMQPYFFPYLGYWQLLNQADRFVIYDDVNYIKGGWINRNRILINGEPRYLTMPLLGASPNKLISNLAIEQSVDWRKKMLKSVEGAYRKSHWFSESYPLVEEIICYESNHLATFLKYQLEKVSEFLGINTELKVSSECYSNRNLAGQNRVIDICRLEGASTYLNAEGGRALYDNYSFNTAGISLRFLKMNPSTYIQGSKYFVPNLSIIDVLMSLGSGGVRDLLADFSLIESNC